MTVKFEGEFYRQIRGIHQLHTYNFCLNILYEILFVLKFSRFNFLARMEKKLLSVKLKMKDGAVVDPQSGLDDGPYHVYKVIHIFIVLKLNLT